MSECTKGKWIVKMEITGRAPRYSVVTSNARENCPEKTLVATIPVTENAPSDALLLSMAPEMSCQIERLGASNRELVEALDVTVENGVRSEAINAALVEALEGYVKACDQQGINLGPITGQAKAALESAKGQ